MLHHFKLLTLIKNNVRNKNDGNVPQHSNLNFCYHCKLPSCRIWHCPRGKTIIHSIHCIIL